MRAASILLGRALSPLDLAMGSWRGQVSARGACARLNTSMSGWWSKSWCAKVNG